MPGYQELTPETFRKFQAELSSAKETIKTLKADMEEEEEEKEGTEHEEEEEEMKKGSFKAMKHRLRKAMEDEDDEMVKKGIRKAMDRLAEDEDEEEEKDAEDEEKEEEEEMKEARIASLENELKKPIIDKIMSLNASVDQTLNHKKEKIRLMKASLDSVKKEWRKIEKFSYMAGVQQESQPKQGIPYAFSASVDSSYEGTEDTETMLRELGRPGVQ